MTIDQAAKAFGTQFRGGSWFTMVGVGEWNHTPCLYVYSSNPESHELESIRRDGWHGYHVEVRKCGMPKVSLPK